MSFTTKNFCGSILLSIISLCSNSPVQVYFGLCLFCEVTRTKQLTSMTQLDQRTLSPKGERISTKFIDGGFHKDLRVANYLNTFVFLACQRSVHTKVPLVKPRPWGLLILKFLKNCIFD